MTPPPKKLKVAGSSPDISKRMKRFQCWSIYKIRRRIVFDDVTPEGVAIGTLLVVPGTPDKSYKKPTLSLPNEV